METITFECEVITPMFLAGADGSTPELRPPSIKGAMRFWWRAMNGHLSIDELRRREAELFGGSEGDGKKSSFSIRINNQKLQDSQDKLPFKETKSIAKGKEIRINILEYLCYGTYDYQKGNGNIFNRAYFKNGGTFDIQIQYKNNEKEDIFKSLYLFALFGGLGSRSRNGFGKICIQNNQETFADIECLNPYNANNLKKLIKASDNSSYSSFSKDIKLFKLKNSNYSSYQDTLADLGIIYKDSRIALESKHTYDKRQFIGAPIIVGKGIDSQKSILDRHSKPYFLNVYKNDSGKYDGYILFLPSVYCEGIDKQGINPSELDQKFQTVCNNFNQELSNRMEAIL